MRILAHFVNLSMTRSRVSAAEVRAEKLTMLLVHSSAGSDSR